tara:strand:- start:192 stop:1757 length:1566 start_codon:yes stop_codon:yes gene_type:complete
MSKRRNRRQAGKAKATQNTQQVLQNSAEARTARRTEKRVYSQTPNVGFKPEAHWDNAGHGRRSEGWQQNARAIGPNVTSLRDIPVLRNRSRYEVQNNPFARRAVDVRVASVIGDGLRPHYPHDPTLDELFEQFVYEIDADGIYNFWDIQRAMYEAKLVDGEVLGLHRFRSPEDQATKAITLRYQLQLLEADHLPMTKTDASKRIRAGIEFSELGDRSAYYVLKNHPNDLPNYSNTPSDYWVMPSDRVIHLFRPYRIGAYRGIPFLSSVMLKLHDLDRYEDAELVRKKIAAMTTDYIHKPTVDSNPAEDIYGLSDERATEDPSQNILPREPGGQVILPPGYTVTPGPIQDVGGSYEAFIRSQFRAVSAGTGIPYHLLTGDFSGHNDRTLRVARLDYQRELKPDVSMMVNALRSIWSNFLDAAITAKKWSPPAGRTLAQYKNASWIPDPHAHVHPEQEVNVEIKRIRAGLSTQQRELAKRGLSFAEIVKERAEEVKLIDENKLVFDTDPRVVSGTKQPEEADA